MTLCLLWDVKDAFAFSVIFGVTSLLCALFVGNPYFLMPWISILPRLFVGPVAYGAYVLVKKITTTNIKPFINKSLPLAIGAAIGILTNTVLVISCLAIFFPASAESGFTVVEWLQMCITINFPIELVCAVMLTPVLTVAVEKTAKRFK
jgi:uncharacterized membrane protein